MAENGALYDDEPPETPAHVFAVRAFKTAIFGTPRPPRRDYRSDERQKEDRRGAGGNSQLERPGKGRTEREDDGFNGILGVDCKVATNSRIAAQASPAKGILLTPGTAATRRKNVSFRPIEKDTRSMAKDYGQDSTKQGNEVAVAPSGGKEESPQGLKPRHSTLTKTLIELSKKSSSEQDVPNSTSKGSSSLDQLTIHESQPSNLPEFNPDTTMDLDQPHSRSGVHWKTEYDRYHKRSNREMKRIIKYGQNIKSYAAKKDAEATSLGEKLEKESARAAAMGRKLALLESELRDVQPQESKGKTPAMKDSETQTSETITLSTEFENLRRTAKRTEDQNAMLEKENTALKLSLARVKEEMMSYETRRHAREERMKKREEKHKAAREECERKLAKLAAEHEELLRTAVAPPMVDMRDEILSIEREAQGQDVDNYKQPLSINPAPVVGTENIQPISNDPQRTRSRSSPRKLRQQKTAMDIWTLSSPPSNIENNHLLPKDPTSLPPSSVARDLHRTLKEIDQNLLPSQHPQTKQAPHPEPPKLQPFSNPSKPKQASSPPKESTHPAKAPIPTATRAASLVSKPGLDSRTSTMCSGNSRLPTLPAERVSAAKERLERRRGERRGTGRGG